MKRISILILILCAILYAATCFGATYTFEWTPPTTNTDGSPLTDLAGYNLYDTTSTRTKVNGSLILPSACTGTPVKCSWIYTVGGYLAENEKFVCTAVDNGGLESADSNTATWNARSNPPGSFLMR